MIQPLFGVGLLLASVLVAVRSADKTDDPPTPRKRQSFFSRKSGHDDFAPTPTGPAAPSASRRSSNAQPMPPLSHRSSSSTTLASLKHLRLTPHRTNSSTISGSEQNPRASSSSTAKTRHSGTLATFFSGGGPRADSSNPPATPQPASSRHLSKRATSTASNVHVQSTSRHHKKSSKKLGHPDPAAEMSPLGGITTPAALRTASRPSTPTVGTSPAEAFGIRGARTSMSSVESLSLNSARTAETPSKQIWGKKRKPAKGKRFLLVSLHYNDEIIPETIEVSDKPTVDEILSLALADANERRPLLDPLPDETSEWNVDLTMKAAAPVSVNGASDKTVDLDRLDAIVCTNLWGP